MRSVQSSGHIRAVLCIILPHVGSGRYEEVQRPRSAVSDRLPGQLEASRHGGVLPPKGGGVLVPAPRATGGACMYAQPKYT